MAEPAKQQTYAEYLALEAQSEEKHEWCDGLIYAMAGGTLEHSRLSSAVGRELGIALRGRPCTVFDSDLRLRAEATGRATYADVVVVCGERRTHPEDEHALTNPTLIVEVLSKSTEASDRGEKFSHYRRMPSLQEYVLVAQDEVRIEVYRREGDTWVLREYVAGATVELASIDITLPVDAVYHDPLDASR